MSEKSKQLKLFKKFEINSSTNENEKATTLVEVVGEDDKNLTVIITTTIHTELYEYATKPEWKVISTDEEKVIIQRVFEIKIESLMEICLNLFNFSK